MENYMIKLSKETAERHYKKFLSIHNFEDLTLEQKISVFYQDLEHDILKEITGKKDFFDQLNWLKENQEYVDRGKKTGSIPPTLVSNIHNFKIWRNQAVHGTEKADPFVDPVTYLNLFQTMIKTINFFSEVSIPVEVRNILDKKPELIKPGVTDETPQNINEKLGENESKKRISKELFLNLDRNNSAYSCINALVPQWAFNISNTKFKNDFYIILEDQKNKKLYCFYLPKGTINEPKKIFNQRNDKENKLSKRKPIKNKSIIIISTDDPNFTNKWSEIEEENKFQFIKYKKLEINYLNE